MIYAAGCATVQGVINTEKCFCVKSFFKIHFTNSEGPSHLHLRNLFPTSGLLLAGTFVPVAVNCFFVWFFFLV